MFFSLSQCLVESDTARDCRIERIDVSTHGQLDEKIAVFAHKAADAFLFVTNYECERACQVRVVVRGCGLTRQANHPDILFFKEINGACEVCFLRLSLIHI